MDIIDLISKELNLPSDKIQKALSLFNEGATVPFVARYRKEMTGNLDEVQLINIKDKNTFWVEFLKRQQSILKSISEQGLMTSELKSKIERSNSLQELEDVYLPFKPKKITKGQKAIKQGLKPLALLIKNEQFDFQIDEEVSDFLREDIKTKKDAISGAINILSEWIGESEQVRSRIRGQFERHATINSKVKKGKDEAGANYRDYFDFSQRIERLAAHRTLAILRAEKEGYLRVSIEVDLEKAVENLERTIGRQYQDNSYKKKVFQEAYKRILQPSFESEFKKTIKENADLDSIGVFAENLRQLLLQSPLGAKRILAIDPGFRTGCKMAVIDANGKYKENRTIFPHPPQKKFKEAEQLIRNLVESHKIEAIAVGNGTAGIETEKLCRKIYGNSDVKIFSVNEAGASIYSASEIAREEFPNLDITVRGAISIGRRLMDPLAELVKIDAKSIGVGQYQHDVNQPLLKQKLSEVVESCVNHVGVELNTATYPILAHVSGLGETLAKNIVEYRNEIGGFNSRSQLMKVPKMGKKTFEQAAGFLRIENGDNPLDNTIIHPESYSLAKKIAAIHKVKISNILNRETIIDESKLDALIDSYDQYTIEFVLNELQKPTRDPRSELKEAKRNDLSTISDLIPGMKLNGVINNITNFGAFVDIGIKESGLIHLSELANEYVSNVQDYVSLNQRVSVTVKSVDLDRKRIQLSMK